jgi:hypothetical protein
MQKALDVLKEGNLGVNECCRRHEIPKRLLKRHVAAKVQGGVLNHFKKSMNDQDSYLPEEIEGELV